LGKLGWGRKRLSGGKRKEKRKAGLKEIGGESGGRGNFYQHKGGKKLQRGKKTEEELQIEK